jgi:predicted transcriptional regulator
MRTRRSRDLSRLGQFMAARKIGTCNLAYRAGVSTGYVAALKYGRCDPTLHMMRKIIDAIRGMVGRRVEFGELFDLGE